MPFSPALTAGLLQAAALQDTIVARMVPQRDLFDWTSGILQIIVLLLGIGMLIALILLLLSVRAGVRKVNEQIERLTAETRPLIERATGIVDDAREVVAMVRTDVERLTEAAGAISEQLLDAADVTSQRIDEVNAVLDVLQTELESTAIGTVSAIHGVRVGAHALSEGLAHGDIGESEYRERAAVRRPSMATRRSTYAAAGSTGVAGAAGVAGTGAAHRDDFESLDDIDDIDDIDLDDEATPA
jgi:hypothetical protein